MQEANQRARAVRVLRSDRTGDSERDSHSIGAARRWGGAPDRLLWVLGRCALAGCLLVGAANGAGVKVVRDGDGFRLLRDGKRYFIRGAVGRQFFDQLRRAGGNSVRCGSDLLDAAQEAGLTVLLNLPLGKPRRGFDYNDRASVEKQRDEIGRLVERYKDHPALLIWALGNELSIQTRREQRIPMWKEINELAKLIHEIDPRHPVLMPMGGRYKQELVEVREYCPDLDIIGLNSYQDMLTLPEDVAAQGWNRPYIVTEFGPIGHWQAPKTEWGVPIEQSSSEKAAFYRRAYRHAVANRPQCLGSYAFLWWEKMEKTHTWYGMFLPDGSRTEAVEVMQELWSGRRPDNRAPRIGPLKITVPMADRLDVGAPEHAYRAGGRIRALLDAWDPDGDSLTITWDLRRDVADDPRVGGDFEESVAPIPHAVTEQGEKHATIRLPAQPGQYRLFAYAHDGRGAAGTANLPILVKAVAQAYPKPAPARDASRFGAGIQRTMTLLATSTPEWRKKVRILFYGQSITKQAWWWQVADELRRRFPYADLEVENLALGGYSSPYLIRTTPQDVYAFYPDLVIFHVYGDEEKYEQIIAGIRRQTAAEILIQNDHPIWTPGDGGGPDVERRARRSRRSYEFLPRIAEKYGCGFVDIRTPWKEYLAANHLVARDLLRDEVHLNDHGVYLMAELTARYLQYRPELSGETSSGLVKRYQVGGDVDWEANRLELEFEGNRVDVVAGRGLGGLSARVRIDGRPPSSFPELYVHSRASRAWGADWTAINRVSWERPLLVEFWNLDFTEMSPDTSFFRFRVTGSKTGPDGEGNNRKRFVSRSGRVVIEPDDWAIERAYKLRGTPMPDGFAVRWRVRPQFTDIYEAPDAVEPTREWITTLAQGLKNGRHRLELIAIGPTAPAIQEIRVFRPWLK